MVLNLAALSFAVAIGLALSVRSVHHFGGWSRSFLNPHERLSSVRRLGRAEDPREGSQYVSAGLVDCAHLQQGESAPPSFSDWSRGVVPTMSRQLNTGLLDEDEVLTQVTRSDVGSPAEQTDGKQGVADKTVPSAPEKKVVPRASEPRGFFGFLRRISRRTVSVLDWFGCRRAVNGVFGVMGAVKRAFSFGRTSAPALKGSMQEKGRRSGRAAVQRQAQREKRAYGVLFLHEY